MEPFGVKDDLRRGVRNDQNGQKGYSQRSLNALSMGEKLSVLNSYGVQVPNRTNCSQRSPQKRHLGRLKGDRSLNALSIREILSVLNSYGVRVPNRTNCS